MALITSGCVPLQVASICHDVDHNGLNNNFHLNSQVRAPHNPRRHPPRLFDTGRRRRRLMPDPFAVAQSPLALLYNDVSILENHHCSYACKVLARTENNVFANLEVEDDKMARSKLINCILATDMANHFDVINKFKIKVEATHFKKHKDDDRQILMNMLLHAADLSNPVRPFDIAKQWCVVQTSNSGHQLLSPPPLTAVPCFRPGPRRAWAIIEEFSQQGDMEKRLTLPISPMCDRSQLVRDPTTWTILRKMTLITSHCGATRSMGIKWP